MPLTRPSSKSSSEKSRMSTQSRTYYLIFIALVQILHFFTNAVAQDIEAKIEISAEKPETARVSGRFQNGERNLSFARSFAGFSGLGERIRDVQLFSADGKAVGYQTAVPGEYVADSPFAGWSYTIDLTPRKEQAAAAHVSWIANGQGVLMFGDALPIRGESGTKSSARVHLVLPPGWQQMDNHINGIVNTTDSQSEVVVVGRDLRFRTVHVGETAITIGIAGTWLFTADEIASYAQSIYTNTMEVFGTPATNSVFVNIFKFPQDLPPGQWQADTRGQNITIASSDMPFRTQSLQRLHEQLRHETCHLWIPNGVNLSGNYDWFFEGFALYSSLKLAVAQNRIRFEDLLDTLSRAYAIDARQSDRMSLIEASEKRSSGTETYIYARGMVTAFLCDILLLNKSKSKRSVNDLLHEIYSKHKVPAPRTDGNNAVLGAMKAHHELLPVIEKYIQGKGMLQIQNELGLAGVEYSDGLRVMPRLNGRQKDLLDALGYNNWRRLSPGPIR